MVGGAYCTPFAYLIYHSKYITHTNIVDSGYIYVACIIQNIKISNIKKIKKVKIWLLQCLIDNTYEMFQFQ